MASYATGQKVMKVRLKESKNEECLLDLEIRVVFPVSA